MAGTDWYDVRLFSDVLIDRNQCGIILHGSSSITDTHCLLTMLLSRQNVEWKNVDG